MLDAVSLPLSGEGEKGYRACTTSSFGKLLNY